MAHYDVWTLTVDERGAPRLHNTVTGHFWDLAPGDVVDITLNTSAPDVGAPHYRLSLARQLWLKGARPGWAGPGAFGFIPHLRRSSHLAEFRRWVHARSVSG